MLNKVHLNYHRLSEDLDFTYRDELTSRTGRSKAITPIREKMPDFLKALGLSSPNPQGEGFNNSTQYVFKVKYPSIVTGKEGLIKLEVSLRQPPIDQPVHNVIRHFYQDPFSGDDLFPPGKVLSLSLSEAVAEKLKAAISRKDAAIRDYYDLWHIAESGFNFHQEKFVQLFKRKLSDEGHAMDYRKNFGLSDGQLWLLREQVKTQLNEVIRVDESFDLENVFDRFNGILQRV